MPEPSCRAFPIDVTFASQGGPSLAFCRIDLYEKTGNFSGVQGILSWGCVWCTPGKAEVDRSSSDMSGQQPGALDLHSVEHFNKKLSIELKSHSRVL